MTTNLSAKDSVLKFGLRCRCPRCGEGRLFNGFLTLASRCEACGLDYSFADPADGPAFFVMMTMAIPATAFGIWVELTYEPAAWVHLLTTLPFLLLSCIPPIRPLKGVLVASQYVSKAEEARFETSHAMDTRTIPKSTATAVK
ncbi:DUF983 domain-containing protein [Microvirga puerhi]|uniref:DUF983 domain-containing protein n=1 Tax=Microvirga puerhi TaxID=2876078 RepID=A0ABS7VTM2_9HYPH|nr:DUF983 domain-containing protein [Microvirga puerhi]MBZ6078496.1 DUF983 domain-containing protein [Microvirga puerhi]